MYCMEMTDSGEQEWDMEFKDPFSLQNDELYAYCRESSRQLVVGTSHSYPQNSLAVRTCSSALNHGTSAVGTGLDETVATDTVLPNSKQHFQHHLSATRTNSDPRTVFPLDGEKRVTVNKPGTSLERAVTDPSPASREVTSSLISIEDQLPIPVMLSSAKRFSSDEDVQNQNSKATNQSDSIGLSPTAVANASNSTAHFAYPTYPPPYGPVHSNPMGEWNTGLCADNLVSPLRQVTADAARPSFSSLSSPSVNHTGFNMPMWHRASVPLSVNNCRTGVQVQAMMPPFPAVLPPAASIPIIYNQPHIPVAVGSSWHEANLHMQNIIAKPVTPVSSVSCAAGILRLSGEFATPNATLHLEDRLKLVPVPRAAIPFPAANIGMMPLNSSSHSVVQQQQLQPVCVVSDSSKSNLSVDNNRNIISAQTVPLCDSSVVKIFQVSSGANVYAGGMLPEPVVTSIPATNGHSVSKQFMHKDRTVHTIVPSKDAPRVSHIVSSSVIASTSIPVSTSSSSLKSSEVATKTYVGSVTCANIPSPQMKLSYLDPRMQSNQQRNNSAVSQSQFANAGSSRSLAFVVPVPPPLPSLAELTADNTEIEQKPTVSGLDMQSATAGSTAAVNSVKFDQVQEDRMKAVAAEVRAALKPFFRSGAVDKEAYKQIMRKSVPKICASKSTDISTTRVQSFIDAYVAKVTTADRRKSTGSSSQ